MDKIIEMTLDGRLAAIWVALAFFVIAVVMEVWSARRYRTRRVSARRNSRKY